MNVGGERWRWVALAASLSLAAGRAEAQFRYGYGRFGSGYGYGYLGSVGFGYHPASVRFLNQRALLNASQATMGPVPHYAYLNDPNGYPYRLHDVGYLERFDPDARRAIEAKIGRFSDGPPPDFRRGDRRGRPGEVLPTPQAISPGPPDGMARRPPAPRIPADRPGHRPGAIDSAPIRTTARQF